ncbi:multidrug ABC transporter [Butyrivibrio sp. XPD2002]|jgi:drug/metabolite transporter (DMT)-like permease|uniref:multidrug ABC transporter n=1 Tax=Butyrivibrio sp. XPD2002 TaxID=1280665 RepID=UPI000420BEE9|nr:multidrug ABC transporter [Butyrivibrio sp. XPD2002]MCR5342210.1 multidrug ABC transporter [Butyrivibrio sp.]
MIPFIILALFGQLLASVSQILLKKSSGKEYPNFIRQYLNVLVIGGYGLLVISMLVAIICYGHMPYMYVVIIEPVGYILVMFLSRFVFKEKITKSKLAGMVLILSGILIFYLM